MGRRTNFGKNLRIFSTGLTGLGIGLTGPFEHQMGTGARPINPPTLDPVTRWPLPQTPFQIWFPFYYVIYFAKVHP